MKRWGIILLPLLLLTGCNAPATEATAPLTTESVEPTAEATTVRPPPTPRPSRSPTPVATAAVGSATREEQIEEVFLDQVRTAHPNLEFTEGDGMVVIAEGFCTGYDNGATSDDINELILIGAGVAYTLMELVTIHGAGVGAFCPEHIDKLG